MKTFNTQKDLENKLNKDPFFLKLNEEVVIKDINRGSNIMKLYCIEQLRSPPQSTNAAFHFIHSNIKEHNKYQMYATCWVNYPWEK